MDFLPSLNMGSRHAKDAKKVRPADEDLRGVRAALCVAEEVGESVGRSKVLLGCMPDAKRARGAGVILKNG